MVDWYLKITKPPEGGFVNIIFLYQSYSSEGSLDFFLLA